MSNEDVLKKYFEGYDDPVNQTGKNYNYTKYLADLHKDYLNGLPFNMDIGIDGARHMSRSLVLGLIAKNNPSRAAKLKKKWKVHDTGWRLGYMPRVWPNSKKSAKARDAELEKVRKSDLTKSEKETKMKRIYAKYKQLQVMIFQITNYGIELIRKYGVKL